MPQATRLELTEVAADVAGDVHFPPYQRELWQEQERVSRVDASSGLAYDFVTYQRQAP